MEAGSALSRALVFTRSAGASSCLWSRQSGRRVDVNWGRARTGWSREDPRKPVSALLALSLTWVSCGSLSHSQGIRHAHIRTHTPGPEDKEDPGTGWGSCRPAGCSVPMRGAGLGDRVASALVRPERGALVSAEDPQERVSFSLASWSIRKPPCIPVEIRRKNKCYLKCNQCLCCQDNPGFFVCLFVLFCFVLFA